MIITNIIIVCSIIIIIITFPFGSFRVRRFTKFFGPNVYAEVSKVDAGRWRMMMMMIRWLDDDWVDDDIHDENGDVLNYDGILNDDHLRSTIDIL